MLLLNADAWLVGDALRRLVEFADARPNAAFVGPSLSNPDGTLQRSVRGFPTLWRLATEYLFLRKLAPRSRALNAFYAGGFDHDEVREVESVMGACMLVRREAIDQVGLADEHFFLFSEETDWRYRFRQAGWQVVFFPGAECVHVRGGVARGPPVSREPARAPPVLLRSTAGRARPSARAGSCSWRCGCEARSSAASAAGGIASRRLARLRERRRAPRMTQHRALPPAPLRDGRRPRAGLGARARARRVERRGRSRLVADAVFAALAVTFALGSSITLTIALLAVAGGAAVAAIFVRERPARESIPWRWAAAVAGAVLGILLWRVAGTVQGDGLFHLARARKLLELDELSLRAVGEFADASLHPGYAFPLWHGFLALIARISGTDPEQVVLHLPSILAVLAVVVAYEAGWALFRAAWAAGAVAGAQAAMICFAPGSRRRVRLPRPAGDVVAAAPRAGRARARADRAARADARALRVHGRRRPRARRRPPDVRDLPLDPVRRVPARPRALDETGPAARRASCSPRSPCPAAFFMLWLLPIVADTASVSPDRDEVRRAFEQYPGQLDVRSETSYSLAPEVFTRSGPVAIAALLLIPLAAFAARRRWAAFVVGGSLAVLAFMLVPLLFTLLSDLVSISQARRAAGFLPFAFAFAGGLAVLSRVLWPWLPPIALVAGAVLQYSYPGDFDYAFDDPGPAWVVWFAVVGCAAALVVGFVRRSRPPVEDTAGLAAALFLLPVVAVGLAKWSPVADASARRSSHPGWSRPCGTNVPERADRVLGPGDELPDRGGCARLHRGRAARPRRRHDGRTGRSSARATPASSSGPATSRSPRRYGAEYLVVDRGARAARLRPRGALPRRALRALPAAAGAVAAAAGSLDPEDVAGLEVDRRERRQLLAVQEIAAGSRRLRRPRRAARARAAGSGARGGSGSSTRSSRTTPSPPRCAPAPPEPRRSS